MKQEDVRRETQAMLGSMPGFFDAMPEAHVGTMWEHFRDVQLRSGKIPAKYQQLIMLAVATYSKCKYCTDFHTEVAKALGATNEEITETALLAGLTADFSNYLGGTQYDFDQFKREVRAACKFLGGNGGRAAKADPSAPGPRR
jgi:AhpD family alkylhydroperoxidase